MKSLNTNDDYEQLQQHHHPSCDLPQGLIASAKTYRVIMNDEGLHFIHLGRAMGMKVKSGDRVADALAGKLANKYEQRLEIQLAETEQEISGIPLSALVRRKRYFKVPFTETGAVTAIIKSGHPPRLIIKAQGGKLKLTTHEDYGPDFETIADVFS